MTTYRRQTGPDGLTLKGNPTIEAHVKCSPYCFISIGEIGKVEESIIFVIRLVCFRAFRDSTVSLRLHVLPMMFRLQHHSPQNAVTCWFD